MSTKKSLGQHFLTSQKVVDTIVAEAKLTRDDTVLEIGPGKGMLTKVLLKKAGRVIAVEKDKRLVEYLKEKFRQEITDSRLILAHDDILRCDLSKFQILDSKFKLVANIPYYITGQLLRKFLSGKQQPKRVVLMLQHEVARRITARDGKESLLSISVQAYGTPHYVAKIPKRYFKPRPKVDSAILSIENISRPFFKKGDEELFFKLVKIGFRHKRKLLKRNVEELFVKDIEKIFRQCSIPPNARAEEVPLKQWKCLAKKLQ